jgi:membrane associated rhomboid family serine protease
MTTYYRNPSQELKHFFTGGSILSRLILINAAVWVLVKMASVFFFLANITESGYAESWFLHYFGLPAYLPSLASHPWSLVTYMFLHYDFFHILFNMLWLFWFGKIFMEYLNSRQLLQVYLTGGLAGGLLYILAYNIFPVYAGSLDKSLALGASASVMAIVAAISFYVPNYSVPLIFFGRVKILYLAIILFVIDFFSISGGNSGGHLAHIGGALWGFLYVMWLKRGKTGSFGNFTTGWQDSIRNIFSTGGKKRDNYSNFDRRPSTDEEYNADKMAKQKKTDDILEKISRGGYESLTRDEKEFLFKSSGKK